MEKEVEILKWNEIKIKLKRKYANLTLSDLAWRDTNQDDLLRTIANSLGISVKEIKQAIQLS
ncbi:MAG TPA: general stress protein CsbD [Bacteroidales bacterium]|nr:general stress protein CsbD [Bacteroidales bacterium]